MPRTPLWISETGAFLDVRCPLPLDRPFTAAQAGELGVSRFLLSQLVAKGLARPLVRGTYAASQLIDTIELRAAALSLVVPDGAVVVDRTAAWLHGVDILPRSAVAVAPPLQVFSRSASRLRRPGVASGLRSLGTDDVTAVSGVQVTTPLRTALDLGRLTPRLDAIAALDGFLRLGVSHDQLLVDVERFKGQRGVIQLRTLAPLADPRAESPPESALRLHWWDAGLPRPEPQHWVYDLETRAYRLDLACPECRYGAEYFGEAFHTDADAERDEDRLTWLREERGWIIDVFTKADVYHRAGDPTSRLSAGLRLARARSGRWVPQTRYSRD